MAEINATERKRLSRAVLPADEKTPVGMEEAADDVVASKSQVPIVL